MADIFGVKTNAKDMNGKSIYEYDRVSFKDGACQRTGTIINITDPWHPEFKLLLDRLYWKDENKPEYLDISTLNDLKILVKTDKRFRIHKTPQDFIEYCTKYDYHKFSKKAI